MTQCLKYCEQHLLSTIHVKVSLVPTLALFFAYYDVIADIVHGMMAEISNSIADYARSSDTLTEQLLFTTPEEELKASWDYSSHHSSTIIHNSDQFFKGL